MISYKKGFRCDKCDTICLCQDVERDAEDRVCCWKCGKTFVVGLLLFWLFGGLL